MSRQLQSDLSDIQALVGLSSPQRQALVDAAVAREIERQNSLSSVTPKAASTKSGRDARSAAAAAAAAAYPPPSSSAHRHVMTAAPPSSSAAVTASSSRHQQHQQQLRQKKLDDDVEMGSDKAAQPEPTQKAQPPEKPKLVSKPDDDETMMPVATTKSNSPGTEEAEHPAAHRRRRRQNRVYNSTSFRFIDYKSALAFLKCPERTNGGAWINPTKSGKLDRRFLCGQPGHLEAGCHAAAIIKPVFAVPPTLDGKNKPVASYYEVLYSTDEHKEPAPSGIITDAVTTTAVTTTADDGSLISIGGGGGGDGSKGGKGNLAAMSSEHHHQSDDTIVPEVWKCMEELLNCNEPETVKKLLDKKYPSVKLPTLEQIQSSIRQKSTTAHTKRAKTSGS